MVVAGDDEDAAVRRRAVGVAVLERVAGAVDAGTLAVPHREDALGGALGIRLDALRAEHCGRAELLVDRGKKAHARSVEQLLRLPRLLVDHAERRAAIAAQKAPRCDARGNVARVLHQEQPHERLRAGEKHGACSGGEVVGERVVGTGERGRHGGGLRKRG